MGGTVSHAPKGRAFDDYFDRPRELGVLGERVIDVDGLLRVSDADLGDDVLRIHALE